LKLISTAILTALVGVLGWFVYDHRHSRQENRNALVLALDTAETGLRQEFPSYPAVETALAQAEQRFPNGGCDDLRERHTELARGMVMLRRLDNIESELWTLDDARPGDRERTAAAAYEAAFREYGAAVADTPPDELVTVVRRSPISHRLTVALDDWFALDGRADLIEVLSRLDDDPNRGELRRAYAARDGAEIARRTAALDPTAITPTFARLVGGHRLTPPDHALRVLTAAHARHPTHFGLASHLGTYWSHPKRGNPARAEGYWRVALALRPEQMFLHNNLGVVLTDQGEWEAALAAYGRAVALDPSHPAPRTGVGNVHRARREWDRAVAEYRAAIALDRNYALAHTSLGHVLRAQRKWDEALEAYRAACRLTPHHPAPFAGVVNTLLEQGQVEGAAKEADAAVKRFPLEALGHYTLGKVRYARKEWDGAVRAYNEAIRLDARYSAAHWGIGQVRMSQQNWDAAVEAFGRAAELQPVDPAAHHELGRALDKRGERERAIRAYRRAIDLEPMNPLPLNSLGTALNATDPAAAEDAFRRAIALDEKYANAHYGLGTALYHQKRWDDAAAAYKQALSVRPKYPFALNGLGNVHRAKGEWERAGEYYRQAITQDAGYHSAYANLVAMHVDRGHPAEALTVVRAASTASSELKRAFGYRRAALACLVASGPGTSGGDAAAHRAEALFALQEELTAFQKLAVTKRAGVFTALSGWLSDPNLAEVRAVARLPEAEREGWGKLWDEVRRLQASVAPWQQPPVDRPDGP
jgi:tetratricopeptide (TPR) repeat protein